MPNEYGTRFDGGDERQIPWRSPPGSAPPHSITVFREFRQAISRGRICPSPCASDRIKIARTVETDLGSASDQRGKSDPLSITKLSKGGAAYRTRTCDPRITNAMLYQLS